MRIGKSQTQRAEDLGVDRDTVKTWDAEPLVGGFPPTSPLPTHAIDGRGRPQPLHKFGDARKAKVDAARDLIASGTSESEAARTVGLPQQTLNDRLTETRKSADLGKGQEGATPGPKMKVASKRVRRSQHDRRGRPSSSPCLTAPLGRSPRSPGSAWARSITSVLLFRT